LTGTGSIRLRPATLDDLELLEHWDQQPHVVFATGDDDSEWADELTNDDPATETLLAELDGRPIGVVQIIDPAEERSHYWGEVGPGLRAIDIWIGDEGDLGQGNGARMMQLALERCFAPPEVSAVLIDPLVVNVRAIAFYQRLGFVPVEVRTFGTDDCLVHRLDRAAWSGADGPSWGASQG
jgi:aminoglycoside 6'-N-acetyltransferase